MAISNANSFAKRKKPLLGLNYVKLIMLNRRWKAYLQKNMKVQEATIPKNL